MPLGLDGAVLDRSKLDAFRKLIRTFCNFFVMDLKGLFAFLASSLSDCSFRSLTEFQRIPCGFFFDVLTVLPSFYRVFSEFDAFEPVDIHFRSGTKGNLFVPIVFFFVFFPPFSLEFTGEKERRRHGRNNQRKTKKKTRNPRRS